MESKDLFVLAYSWYEDYVPYYFWGSELSSEEEFEKLCDSLIDQAAFNAIEVQSSIEDGGSWVGWHEIVESLIPLLEKEGYKQFEPKIKVYHGAGIINEIRDAKVLGFDATEAVIKYNKNKKEDIY